jgi:hypothetical protein
MSSISEVTLPDDVSILLGETGEGVVSAVDVRPADVPVEEVWAMPEPALAVEESQETMLMEPVVSELEIPADPPASGFVQSVTLGEVGEPDIPSGPVELIDPEEFALPGFDIFGERDSDADIEEID